MARSKKPPHKKPDVPLCVHGIPYCDDCRLQLFLKSVAQYRGLLIHIPPLEPPRLDGSVGPEHLHFSHNVLHAMLLRKYVSGDVTSLDRVLASLHRKVGCRVYTRAEADLLREAMGNVQTAYSIAPEFSPGPAKPLEIGRMVKAFLYGVALHPVPEASGGFGDFPAYERRLFPTALVEWIEQVSYRVIELESAIFQLSGQLGWGYPEEFILDEAFVQERLVEAMFSSEPDDISRRAGEYIARRGAYEFLYFVPPTEPRETDNIAIRPRPISKVEDYGQRVANGQTQQRRSGKAKPAATATGPTTHVAGVAKKPTPADIAARGPRQQN